MHIDIAPYISDQHDIAYRPKRQSTASPLSSAYKYQRITVANTYKHENPQNKYAVPPEGLKLLVSEGAAVDDTRYHLALRGSISISL